MVWCCYFLVWGTVIFWVSFFIGLIFITCCFGFFFGGIDGFDLVLFFIVWKISCLIFINFGFGFFFDVRDGFDLILVSG